MLSANSLGLSCHTHRYNARTPTIFEAGFSGWLLDYPGFDDHSIFKRTRLIGSEGIKMDLPVAFLKMCRRCARRSKIADLGTELSSRDFLIITLVLRRLLL